MITIYLITNIKNNKVYVGQTSQTIQKRFNKHKSAARCKITGGCFLLNKAINKHGEDNFIITQIITVDNFEIANELETFFIKLYGGIGKNGYNICAEGTTHLHTEQTKRKLSIIKTGTHHTDEAKERISKATKGENNPFFGRKHSEEAKTKISISRENYTGINHPWFGQEHSEESKKLMSDSHKNSGRYIGEKNPAAKLNVENVIQIRKLLETGLSRVIIARIFNVSKSTIDHIKTGRIWSSVK